MVVEGEWRTLAPGASASVPVGALHTFRNRSGEVVRVRNWHRPAMRFEDFIERTCRTLQAVGVKRKRDPRVFLYLSMVMLDFDDTLVPGRRRERIARVLPTPAPRPNRLPPQTMRGSAPSGLRQVWPRYCLKAVPASLN